MAGPPVPDRPDRPQPGRATAALAAPGGQLCEAGLNRRRGAPQIAPGAGRRPLLTLTGKLSAAILHHRYGLPQRAIAALFQVRPETINRHIGDIRQLLHQTGYAIQPSTRKLATLEDLYRYAAEQGIPIPQIKAAC